MRGECEVGDEVEKGRLVRVRNSNLTILKLRSNAFDLRMELVASVSTNEGTLNADLKRMVASTHSRHAVGSRPHLTFSSVRPLNS